MHRLIEYLNNMNENGWINYSDYSNLIDMVQQLQAENSQIDEYKCVIDDVCRQYKELEAENDKLRTRLENAIELPCKVGDKIYDIFENHTREWEVVKILLVKDGYFVQCGHQGTDDYMHVSNKEYGLWWFTDRTKAEAKLKEVGSAK